ncbi:MAG TPA: cysteine--tRNA ligase [bacterium]|nr:cysteine--tRNA ligase [bacterium]
MALKIYNTLTRRKEEFVPLTPGRISMYVCGPNLYGPSHVGHAMSFLVFDVIRRYLEYRGYRVTHVQNFTDVEDRIIETARAEGTTIQSLAARYIDRFLREMDGLGVRRADYYPRATETIPKMIEIIQGLERRDLAYVADGDVFFRVTAFPGYGRLSGRSLDEMQAGARIEVDPRKEHPMDFVLWKAAKEGEPAWESPWGAGRPGWHIECSAMSISLLGPQLDIHGGGQDVIFPHHENEIAQSEGYTGQRPFVRYWIHNGLLRLSADEEKMTRHLGNIVSIREALGRFHPDTIRVFVLSSHYRSPTLWSAEALEAAARGAERLRTAVENADDLLASAPRPDAIAPESERSFAELDAVLDAGHAAIRGRFETAMDDDFNTPGALAALFDLASAINRAVDAVVKRRTGLAADQREVLARGIALLRELGAVLGLRLVATPTPAQAAALYRLAQELSRERPDLFDPARLGAVQAPATAREDDEEPGAAAGPPPDAIFQPLVELVAEGRLRARQAKDWTTGDRVRARLAELGVLLEDTPTGVKWRVR